MVLCTASVNLKTTLASARDADPPSLRGCRFPSCTLWLLLKATEADKLCIDSARHWFTIIVHIKLPMEMGFCHGKDEALTCVCEEIAMSSKER